jgi:hypothetical protein
MSDVHYYFVVGKGIILLEGSKTSPAPSPHKDSMKPNGRAKSSGFREGLWNSDFLNYWRVV